MRHQAVNCKADFTIYVSERRTWFRLRDPASIRRTLSTDFHRILAMCAGWLQSVLLKCLRPKQLQTGESAADAMASADVCQIREFIRFPSGTTICARAENPKYDLKNQHLQLATLHATSSPLLHATTSTKRSVNSCCYTWLISCLTHTPWEWNRQRKRDFRSKQIRR